MTVYPSHYTFGFVSDLLEGRVQHLLVNLWIVQNIRRNKMHARSSALVGFYEGVSDFSGVLNFLNSCIPKSQNKLCSLEMGQVTQKVLQCACSVFWQ